MCRVRYGDTAICTHLLQSTTDLPVCTANHYFQQPPARRRRTGRRSNQEERQRPSHRWHQARKQLSILLLRYNENKHYASIRVIDSPILCIYIDQTYFTVK